MAPFSILIVDDDEEFRGFVVTILQEEGYHVTTAASGREAIERVLVEKPHVMLVDLVMPDMPGNELCRTIKSDPVLKDIIVIMVSGTTDVEAKLSCFSSGASEYLVKPVEPRELIARIKGFLRLIDEFKQNPPSSTDSKDEPLQVLLPQPSAKERSHETIDFVGSTSDSFTKIKPKYGVYRIESLIGSGAMGHVFKAYDEPLERFVAVKILSKRLSNSPAFVERFRREAKVLAALNHPGIAFIYSFGEEEGEHYFAIQWCPGGSVADLIRKKQQIDLLPAVDILLQASQALSAASKKGIVHRDIKPSNILFDENQQVKIVDFGLALAEKASARITHAQEFLGTPSFMAPEQAQSASVDHRADIYSLGITFFYMLYGKSPFEAGSAIEMVIKHASQPFPSLDDLGGKIPRHAYAIIEKMTQKSPEDRYVDYPALIQDLEQLRNTLLSESQWRMPRAENIAVVPSVKTSDLFEMLVTLHSQNASGVLTVRWGPLQKRFMVRHREIILFESSQQEESIWNILIQKKLLKKEETPPMSDGLEASLNRFLLNHTFTMEQFKTSYRELMKVAMIQVFFWPVFEGEFANASIEHDAFATISIANTLLDAARSLIDYQRLKKNLSWEEFIVRTAKFEQVLSTLNLKPEESFIASRFEGQDTSLKTLQLLTGLPEENIARFVYALEKLGALKFMSAEARQIPKKTPIPSPAQPPIAPVSPKPPPSPSPSTPPLRPTARSKSDEDYLMRLMMKRFSSTPPTNATPEEKEKKEQIAQVTRQVRMEVIKSDKKIETEHHIRVAEQFYQLAQDKFGEGDFWNVAQLCKQAIRNNPHESKYYHLMATAYAQHPRFGKDAEQCFYKALEIDPWNPDYHVDLAVFYYEHGLLKRATAECQKTLKLAPHHEKAAKLMKKLSEKDK